MRAIRGFVRAVDALNDWVGRTVAWLTLGCVLTCFAVVVLRYAFGTGFPWLQELYVWPWAWGTTSEPTRVERMASRRGACRAKKSRSPSIFGGGERLSRSSVDHGSEPRVEFGVSPVTFGTRRIALMVVVVVVVVVVV